MNVEEIKDLCLKDLKSSFLTGSYYFTKGKSFDDIDIVLCPFLSDNLDDILKELEKGSHEIKDGDYNISKKIFESWDACKDNKTPRKYVNLIMVHPLEWHCWKIGTDIMDVMPKIPEEKMKRHALFEGVRSLVKSTLSEWHLGIESVRDELGELDLEEKKQDLDGYLDGYLDDPFS